MEDKALLNERIGKGGEGLAMKFVGERPHSSSDQGGGTTYSPDRIVSDGGLWSLL